MKQMLGLVAMLCLSTQALAQSSDWDGTWAGSWGGQTAAKIIISEGNVLEYDYRGHPQKKAYGDVSGLTLLANPA